MKWVAMILVGLLLFVGLRWLARRRSGHKAPSAESLTEAPYASGVKLHAAGRRAEAEAAFRSALEARPGHVEAWCQLGKLLQETGRLGEAEQAYRQALAIQPGCAETLGHLGVLLTQTDRLPEAGQVFRQALLSNPSDPQAQANLGVLLHKEGRIDEAAAAFREALRIAPTHAEACNNLAALLIAAGRLGEAESTYRQLLRLNPNAATVLNDLGILLNGQGRVDEAATCFRQATQAHADFAEAHYRLGSLLKASGRLDEAEDAFRQVTRIAPHSAAGFIALGLLLEEGGWLEEAEEAYRHALAVQPDSIETLMKLGDLLLTAERLDEAEAAYRDVLAIRPDSAEALNNLAGILRALGRFEEAEACYRQALAIQPALVGAWANWGSLLKRLKRFDEAKAAFRQAVSLDPGDLGSLSQLGGLLHYSGQLDAASAVFEEVLRHNPVFPLARLKRAYLNLLKGHFEQGWEDHEYRWAFDLKPYRSLFPELLWDGKPFPGQTLFVHCEQGIGDSLQFFRYIPLLADQGDKIVLGWCHDELLRLFRANAPEGVAIVGRDEGLPRFDLHCPLLSLPKLFDTRLDTIPAHIPYLSPPAEAIASCSPLPGSGVKIGLVWAGNPAHENDHSRSMELAMLEPLFAIPGIDWVVLQKDRRPEGFEALAQAQNWLDPVSHAQDFADTAAIVGQLDLVLGVDTAVIHLAGAMGKPVWLLLPMVPDWRWLLGREDSPWYPTMRLFRQQGIGQWPTLVEQVAWALREFVSERRIPR